MADTPKTSGDKQISEDKAKVDTVKKDIPKEPDKTVKTPTDKTVGIKEPDKTVGASKTSTDKTVGTKEPDKTAGASKTPTDKAVGKKEPIKTAEPTADKTAKVVDFSAIPKGKTAETATQVTGEKPLDKQAEAVQAEPKQAPRSTEAEQIVHLKATDLHAFKNHPFQVKDDEEMKAMVESVKDKGVTQPLIVRPLEEGGYEIVSGHRRQKASELAGYAEIPCIIRNMTDEQAITQMVEDNTNQRESILPSERAMALKMQLDAIKHQGARTSSQLDPNTKGQRSNEIVAERNKMTVKQVQRYICLNNLVPDLLKLVDDKGMAFTPAVEISYIKPKNQEYIAVAIESEQAAPSLSQAQRMRELDQKGILNPDIIDGIMLEDKKKEADKVILSSKELSGFFGEDKTPKEMKAKIMELLGDWKEKQPPELGKTDKKKEQQEK